MNSTVASQGPRAPVKGSYTYGSITDKIADIVLARPTHWGWIAGAMVSGALTLLLIVAVSWLFIEGVGI